MNTLELKTKLHSLIESIDNTIFLQQVKYYLEEFISGENWYENLTEAQKVSIQKGIEEAKEGKGTPHAEVQKQIRQLIEKHQQKSANTN